MTNGNHTQSFAIRAAVVAALLVGVTTLLRMIDGASLPFLERERASFASYLTDTAFAVSLIVTLVGFRRLPDGESANDHFGELGAVTRVLIRLSIAVTIAIAYFLATVFFMSILSRLTSIRPSVPLIVALFNALYAGFIAYSAAFTSARLGPLRLLMLAGGVMVAGLVAAVALSTSLDWWTQAISFLGVDEYGFIFNMTFILSGLLLVAVLQDKMGDLDVLRRRGIFTAPYLRHLRSIMLLMCFLLAGVGFFPYQGRTALLHQVVASGALILFLVIPLATWRLLPIYPPRYRQITIALIVLSLAAIFAHYVFGWMSFSMMELILLAIGGAWLVTFYTYTRAFIMRHDPRLLFYGQSVTV